MIPRLIRSGLIKPGVEHVYEVEMATLEVRFSVDLF